MKPIFKLLIEDTFKLSNDLVWVWFVVELSM